jgi:hypothetical protein
VTVSERKDGLYASLSIPTKATILLRQPEPPLLGIPRKALESQINGGPMQRWRQPPRLKEEDISYRCDAASLLIGSQMISLQTPFKSLQSKESGGFRDDNRRGGYGFCSGVSTAPNVRSRYELLMCFDVSAT